MNRKKILKNVLVTLFSGTILTASHLVSAQEARKYVGVKKCSMCHKSETKGNQYGKWLESNHAKAYQTLGTDAAKEVAVKLGLTENPQEAPKCLKCHVTAYGADPSLIEEGFNKEDGVQCESCHGAGSDYKPFSIMKDKAQAITNGLIMPTKEDCIKCHNEESPAFHGFNFDESYEKIKHLIPPQK